MQTRNAHQLKRLCDVLNFLWRVGKCSHMLPCKTTPEMADQEDMETAFAQKLCNHQKSQTSRLHLFELPIVGTR